MTMPRSTPAAEGVDARGLLAVLDAFEAPGHGFHSLMVARHGRVIAEGWWTPYARDRAHLGYSLSKSFTATVLGHLVVGPHPARFAVRLALEDERQHRVAVGPVGG